MPGLGILSASHDRSVRNNHITLFFFLYAPFDKNREGWNFWSECCLGLLKMFQTQPLVLCPLNFSILCIINALTLFILYCQCLLFVYTYNFVCCSTVKLWALTGQPLLEMIGHSSLVYSVDAHSSGLIASGSEDRSLKLWKGAVFCVLIINALAFSEQLRKSD